MAKDLEYHRLNCEEDFNTTPTSVLRYIGELQKEIERVKEISWELKDVAWDNASCNYTYARINDLTKDL